MAHSERLDFDLEQREKILKKLTKYGDSLLKDKEPEKPKQNTARKPSLNTRAAQQVRTESLNKGRRWKKQQKKKIAALSAQQLEEDSDKVTNRTSVKCGENRHLAVIREKLGLNEYRPIHPVDSSSQKSAMQQSPVSKKEDGKRRPPQVVVFNDPAKRKENKGELKRQCDDRLQEEDNDAQQSQHKFVTMRHDVKMFGIQGMTKESSHEARQKHLIELGAKPPKRPYVNYREFQTQRKIEVEEQKAKEQLDKKLGLKIAKRKDRNKKLDKGVDGQVGRYKDGGLYVDRKSLQDSRTGHGRGRGKRR